MSQPRLELAINTDASPKELGIRAVLTATFAGRKPQTFWFDEETVEFLAAQRGKASIQDCLDKCFFHCGQFVTPSAAALKRFWRDIERLRVKRRC